jgi:hypothetical protein
MRPKGASFFVFVFLEGLGKLEELEVLKIKVKSERLEAQRANSRGFMNPWK